MTREEYMTKNIELNDKIRYHNMLCEESLADNYNQYMDAVARAAKKKRDEDSKAKRSRAINVAHYQSELQRLKTEFMVQQE